MKLSNKIVERAVSEAVGDDVLPLIKNLRNKKNVSEFKIAESISKQINETRNMLYRLYHENLVSFIRKKDKKKGWYIYYWTFNVKRIKYLTSGLKKKRLTRLKEHVKREKGNYFYSCKNRCVRLDFEKATDFEFKCPECGLLMDQDDNTTQIVELENEIKRLEKELK